MRKLISKRFGLLSALLLTFVAVGGLAFAAKAHKHTFEKKWTTDETSHWHVATCGTIQQKFLEKQNMIITHTGEKLCMSPTRMQPVPKMEPRVRNVKPVAMFKL